MHHFRWYLSGKKKQLSFPYHKCIILLFSNALSYETFEKVPVLCFELKENLESVSLFCGIKRGAPLFQQTFVLFTFDAILLIFNALVESSIKYWVRNAYAILVLKWVTPFKTFSVKLISCLKLDFLLV